MKIETPVLRRLGPVPFWRGEEKCLDGLESAYRKAMEAARRTLARGQCAGECGIMGRMKVILASGSPRRAKILRDLGVDFEVVKTDAPEVSYPGDPARTVVENALAKGAAANASRVLSADTIVWLAGKIYGKPRDCAEAKAFLRELSGRTHTVFTGVAFDGEAAVVRSDVTIKPLSESAIDAYVAAVNPIDRAGAYDIDEHGEMLVASYTGSYENIMGLPVEPLRKWGIVG